jgi:hypothetical protein
MPLRHIKLDPAGADDAGTAYFGAMVLEQAAEKPLETSAIDLIS